MKQIKTRNKIKKYILLTLALLLFMVYFFPVLTVVHAEETVYTNVLEDLRKDENFSTENYPVDNYNYSLSVIQIAESESKELFVYVYQPCLANEDLIATSINISLTIDDETQLTELDYHNYKLTLLNSSGTLYKYKVNNLTVSDDLIRYYDISSIYREWHEEYDKALPEYTNNNISEVAFEVGKQYVVKKGVITGCYDIEVINITSKYVGFVRYKDGYSLYPTSCDSHFVAFSTDREIEDLQEAEIYFGKQDYTQTHYLASSYDDSITYSNYTPNLYKYLDGEQTGSYTQSGLLKYTWDWKRIVTANDFITEFGTSGNIFSSGIFNSSTYTGFTDEVGMLIKNCDWVLRFLETDYSETYYENSSRFVYKGSIVNDVSILRLKFETNGVVYNLGVVDNKQSGSITPSTETLTVWQKIGNFIEKIFNILKSAFYGIVEAVKFLIDKWYVGLGVIAGALGLIILLKIFK